MKLADNPSRHKISQVFKILELGALECVKNVYCLWDNGVSKPARSFLIGSSSNLLVTWTGIKSRTSLPSGWNALVTSELHALERGLNFQ